MEFFIKYNFNKKKKILNIDYNFIPVLKMKKYSFFILIVYLQIKSIFSGN